MQIIQNAVRSIFYPKYPVKGGANHRSAAALFSFLGPGPSTKAGAKVNSDTSLKVSAFYCGVNLLSDAVAMLPIEIKQLQEDQIVKHPDHYLDQVLNHEPNSYLNSYYWRKIMMLSSLLKGDGFSEKIVDRRGYVTGFRFLPYNEVAVLYDKAADRVSYKYKERVLAADDVLHIKCFSQDGIKGRSIIQYAADTLGISLSAIEYGANAFNDKGLGQGVVESDRGGLNSDNKIAISNAFSEAMSSGNPYRVAVLDEGMKYKSIALTPAESQFIEVYLTGVADVARFLNIPPHKLKDLTNANYSNVYQMNLEYLADGVLPWVQQLEAEFTKKLLTTSEKRQGYKVTMDEASMLRADLKAKGAYTRSTVLSGIITQNEARALLGYNPMDDEIYNQLLQPVNMQNAEQLENANNE